MFDHLLHLFILYPLIESKYILNRQSFQVENLARISCSCGIQVFKSKYEINLHLIILCSTLKCFTMRQIINCKRETHSWNWKRMIPSQDNNWYNEVLLLYTWMILDWLEHGSDWGFDPHHRWQYTSDPMRYIECDLRYLEISYFKF